MKTALSATAEQSLCDGLRQVEQILRMAALRSPLGSAGIDSALLLGLGKRLRARLALRVAPVAAVSTEQAVAVAAAVEMVHAASLLHDDVIDGGFLRRGAPAFWVTHGVQGAILVGDLLFCAAYDLLRNTAPISVLHALIEHTQEVCAAEVEQELVLRGRALTWADVERSARRKTGALFAFAAFGAAGAQGPLAAALREAGYLAGTAYQLSDDMLDVLGHSQSAGKTLGRDAERKKCTVASLVEIDAAPVARRLKELAEAAERRLADWPSALEMWRAYWAEDLQPALDANLFPDNGASDPLTLSPASNPSDAVPSKPFEM